MGKISLVFTILFITEVVLGQQGYDYNKPNSPSGLYQGPENPSNSFQGPGQPTGQFQDAFGRNGQDSPGQYSGQDSSRRFPEQARARDFSRGPDSSRPTNPEQPKFFPGSQNQPGRFPSQGFGTSGQGPNDEEGDYSAIPGEPENDYPVFYSVPDTSFNCEQQPYPGYYADIEGRCQVFHICINNQTYDFLCPNGTIFHQEYLVCVWWYQFDCNIAKSFYYINENIYDYSINGDNVQGGVEKYTGATGQGGIPGGQQSAKGKSYSGGANGYTGRGQPSGAPFGSISQKPNGYSGNGGPPEGSYQGPSSQFSEPGNQVPSTKYGGPSFSYSGSGLSTGLGGPAQQKSFNGFPQSGAGSAPGYPSLNPSLSQPVRDYLPATK